MKQMLCNNGKHAISIDGLFIYQAGDDGLKVMDEKTQKTVAYVRVADRRNDAKWWESATPQGVTACAKIIEKTGQIPESVITE